MNSQKGWALPPTRTADTSWSQNVSNLNHPSTFPVFSIPMKRLYFMLMCFKFAKIADKGVKYLSLWLFPGGGVDEKNPTFSFSFLFP